MTHAAGSPRNSDGSRNVGCLGRHRLANQRQVREVVVQVDSLIEASLSDRIRQSDWQDRLIARWAIARGESVAASTPRYPATRQRSRVICQKRRRTAGGKGMAPKISKLNDLGYRSRDVYEKTVHQRKKK